MNKWKKVRLFSGVLLCLVFVPLARACLWDKDTLADEQRGLPSMTAIIVGRYERHTREFYLRRRNLAMRALKTASPAQAKLLMDDIAVANDKTGRDSIAIQTMQDKMKRFGVDYRTAANIGTFYAHAGDLKNAELWISRALKINPQAHFGREWVQLRAIRYLRANGKKPFWNDVVEASVVGTRNNSGAGDAVFKELGLGPNALEGIAALIKIGDREVPELYAALAQLLVLRGDTNLAVLAMWRAMELGGATHPQYKRWKSNADRWLLSISPRGPKHDSWTKIWYALRGYDRMHAATEIATKQLAPEYKAQREYADRWVNAYQDYEIALMDAGKDPENRANYAAFYKQWLTPQQNYVPPPQHDSSLWPVGAATVFSLGFLALWLKKKRKKYA